MKLPSRQVFEKHFDPDSLRELIDIHLAPSSPRGVDGTNYDRFLEKVVEEVKLISLRAKKGKYRFSPYRQKLIIKDAKSPPRQVSIPTVRDRIALRALNNFLSEIFYGARPQHSHPVVSSVIESAQSAKLTEAFIKLDIKAFYDEINHDVLIRTLRARIRHPVALALIVNAIKTPTGSKKSDYEFNSLGVPQGLSISNILASIYLGSIDQKYSSMPGLKYHRYVDDILCVTNAEEAKEVAASISRDLKGKKKLKVHPIGSGKSAIIPITGAVDYLGYTLRADSVSVRRSTEKKMLSSLMRIIHSATKDTLTRSLWRLNLRISGCRLNDSNIGWMFYFSQINDMRLLARMDAQVKKAVVKKFGLSSYGNCKRLIKAFYEIKFNQEESNYYINFDAFDRDKMTALLARIFPGRFENLDKKSEVEVRRIFNRVVTKEVREMERDTLGGFS